MVQVLNNWNISLKKIIWRIKYVIIFIVNIMIYDVIYSGCKLLSSCSSALSVKVKVNMYYRELNTEKFT